MSIDRVKDGALPLWIPERVEVLWSRLLCSIFGHRYFPCCTRVACRGVMR